jgi:hypothetical protein
MVRVHHSYNETRLLERLYPLRRNRQTISIGRHSCWTLDSGKGEGSQGGIIYEGVDIKTPEGVAGDLMNRTAEIRRKIAQYVRVWERRGYPAGIPDEAPARLEQLGKVPSYRLICIALMKNDKNLLYLGFSRPECQLYNELKRQEFLMKGKAVWTSKPEQRKMF